MGIPLYFEMQLRLPSEFSVKVVELQRSCAWVTRRVSEASTRWTEVMAEARGRNCERVCWTFELATVSSGDNA
jgi:hypothetical protein